MDELRIETICDAQEARRAQWARAHKDEAAYIARAGDSLRARAHKEESEVGENAASRNPRKRANKVIVFCDSHPSLVTVWVGPRGGWPRVDTSPYIELFKLY